eukprot:UN23933
MVVESDPDEENHPADAGSRENDSPTMNAGVRRQKRPLSRHDSGHQRRKPFHIQQRHFKKRPLAEIAYASEHKITFDNSATRNSLVQVRISSYWFPARLLYRKKHNCGVLLTNSFLAMEYDLVGNFIIV